MHSGGEFDVFHLFYFPVVMLMMIFDMDQSHTKNKKKMLEGAWLME